MGVNNTNKTSVNNKESVLNNKNYNNEGVLNNEVRNDEADVFYRPEKIWGLFSSNANANKPKKQDYVWKESRQDIEYRHD
ncbi:hypothetical protein O3M35_000811 [Rhynocoris fuscipes]|uniref:Uncharacterized protein n=1 Tax=Rhynocoris fuscipes TaxID=488301 RepID=A0AAW1DSP1_9HEMI